MWLFVLSSTERVIDCLIQLLKNTGCKSVHHEPLLFHLLRPTCANIVAVDRGFDRRMGQTKDF
jgi:hypothetical protein